MKWNVVVIRTENKRRNFQVEADTEDEANVAAIEAAANHEWSRGEAEYEGEEATKVK
ncbi:MAG: hypothetical protein P9M03_08020 [Candidatus Theseobacter exili]|nr:hypothetical protein [Candidatus Theseobacter exili]